MEEQSHSKPRNQPLPDDFEILRLIQLTYHSKTTAEVSHAEAALNALLTMDNFVEKLFHFLENQDQLNKTLTSPQQFKVGVSLLIKKFSYNFSKNPLTSKEIFIEKLFCLLVSHLNSKAKQQLGIALEYILNHDQDCTYKPKVIEKVSQILESQPDNQIFQGSLIISVACLNSLIEVDDQFAFIWKILPSLIKNSINLLQMLKNQPQQNLVFEASQKITKLSRRVFELIELAFSRLLDEEDLIEDKLQEIRNHPGLHFVLFSYLSCFGHKKSILSTIPHINAVKETVVQIVFGLYRTKPMPQNMFNLFFLTLLIEPDKQSYDDEEQHIMSRVMELLQDYLDNTLYMNTFADHKMQLLVCLLMYSVTKPDEFDLLEDSPERFVEMAEDFTEGFKGSVSTKVRAASFLKVFAAKFDQALRNILQIVVIIITAHVQAEDKNSTCLQLYNNLKQEFSSMGFFKLDSVLHLQTCLNVLSLLSPFINRRDDLKKVVYAIMITHFDRLQKIQHPIVVLRLIRMVGYYPSAIYYNVIKSKMSMGKVYILQGLKAFERILKANKYPQIFEVLSEIFSDLVNVMQVNDHIFETIILNHYERILKKNLGLYNAFLIKIRDTFIQHLEKNLHIIFTCLGYINSMLNKQNEASFRTKIADYFSQMEEFYHKAVEFHTQKLIQSPDSTVVQSSKKVLKNLKNFQDKFIDIYSVLVKKQTNMSNKIVRLAVSRLNNLHEHNKNEEIFKLYNNLFLKLHEDTEVISVFYEGFMQHIRNTFTPIVQPQLQAKELYAQKLQILPNLSYLVSQILASWTQVELSQNDVVWILKALNCVTQDVRQYLLLIILTYAYTKPVQLRDMLTSLNAYYQTLQYLLTTKYEEGLIRKIFLLAMTKLIEIQQTYINDIVRQCIKYLKEQFAKNESKKKQKQHIDPKLRRLILDGQGPSEQEMEEQRAVQHKTTTCSVPEFKHPYMALSQYDQFKIRIWQNSDIIMKLEEKDKNQLREILTMDWVGKNVRKIVSIKKSHDF